MGSRLEWYQVQSHGPRSFVGAFRAAAKLDIRSALTLAPWDSQISGPGSPGASTLPAHRPGFEARSPHGSWHFSLMSPKAVIWTQGYYSTSLPTPDSAQRRGSVSCLNG